MRYQRGNAIRLEAKAVDHHGDAITFSVPPQITIYKPDGTVIVNAQDLAADGDGWYYYVWQSLADSVLGHYQVEVNGTYGGYSGRIKEETFELVVPGSGAFVPDSQAWQDWVDGRLRKEVWVGDPGYGATLQTAITAIGSSSVILRVPAGTHSIAADLTIPANITLRPERGATLAIATTKTLTINGGFEAGLYQVFSWTGSGKVVFGAGAVKEAYPQWWGATGNGTTDDTVAIQAALNSGASTIFLPAVPVKYLISSTLFVPSYTTFQGEGAKSLIFLKDSATMTTGSWILAGAASGGANPPTISVYDIHIKNIAVDGNNDNQTVAYCAIVLGKAYRSTVENCYVTNSGVHGILCWYSNFSRIDNNVVTNWGNVARPGTGIDFLQGNYFCTASGNILSNNAVGEWCDGMSIEGVAGEPSMRNQFCGLYNNTITGVGNHGIIVNYNDFIEVSGNSISYVGGNGIIVLGCTHVTIGPNTVSNVGVYTTWADKTASNVAAGAPVFYNGLVIHTEGGGSGNICTCVNISGGSYSYCGQYGVTIYGDAAGVHGEININGVLTDSCSVGGFYAQHVVDLALGKNLFLEATKITYGANVTYYVDPLAPQYIATTPAIAASTVEVRNTHAFPVRVIITGGTVTVIAKGPTTGALITTGATVGAFILEPNEYIAITYSAAPTWAWLGM